MEKLLPIGSIVYLEAGSTPLAIIATTQFIQRNDGEKLTYFDYAGAIYPQGVNEEEIFYFNHENVAETLFMGYESEQHDRYLDAVAEWKEKNADTFILGKVE